MDKKGGLDILDTIKNLQISDVEFIESMPDSLLKISFTNDESIVIAGSDMDIYLLAPKEGNFH